MPTLENFRVTVFRAVAQHLNFRKAADQLYLTQPAVSLQIKALEEDLGTQLFDRTGSRIALTKSGSLLLDYTSQSSALLTQAEQHIASLSTEHAGQLALGASTTIAQYVLPRLLGTFLREHPAVSPTLISGNTEQIVEALTKHKIELGLIEGPARSRSVKTQAFLEDELVVIASTAHAFAERAFITPAELAASPLLMRERGSGTRHVIEAALGTLGVKRSALNIVMELDSTEAIKSAVEANLGVGFVSRSAVVNDARLDAAFKIVSVQRLRIKRQFLIVQAAGPESPGVALAFRRFLTAHTSLHTAVSTAKPR